MRPKGLEPLAHCLEGSCSIHLSYGRKCKPRSILPLLKKGLCVSIYTQLTDVELEVNGLFTYDRAVCKLDEAVVKEINQKLVL